MNEHYLDLHVHSTQSDGAYTPAEVCALAVQSGLSIISLTDHNFTGDLTRLRQLFPDLTIIQGAEVSAIYTDEAQGDTEVHIIALGIDPESPELQDVLRRNQPDRAPYINAILDKLRHYGIDLGDYDTLCRMYPGKRHIGRMQIARLLVDRGYTRSVDEGFDTYIGGHGKRLCYVKPPLQYVPMEEAIHAILAANAIPVLCHLYYYRLDTHGSEQLVRRFSELTGGKGAMEVLYGRYSQEQRQALAALADKYGLMHSASSDYHGQDETETLGHRFPCDACRPLLDAIGI